MRDEMDDRSVLPWLARETNAEFGAMYATADMTEPVLVFAGMRGFVCESVDPGWALVGDAGYFRDPVTAHVITDAFRDAKLLANAAAAGRDAALAAYQRARDEVTSENWAFTDRIAAFDMDLPELQNAYRNLAEAIKTAQEWMRGTFDPIRLAA